MNKNNTHNKPYHESIYPRGTTFTSISIGYKICNTRLNGDKNDRCTGSFNGRFYNAVLITPGRT